MSSDWRGRGALRYPEYLKIGELLALQSPVSRPPHHDETLFIIAHQVFELWFKLLLHDLDALRGHLGRGELHPSLKLARRMGEVQKNLVAQVPMLETMSALDFLEFRTELEGASGFQSAQFRELEVLLGVREDDRVPLPEARERGLAPYLDRLAPDERARIQARLLEPPLEAAFLDALARMVVPREAGRAYLVDIPDLLGLAGPEVARMVPALVEPLAEVAPDAGLGRLLARLEALPLWARLGAAERVVVLERARRGRLLEGLAKTTEVDPASPEALEVKLVDEELGRRVTVPLDAVRAALASAGAAAEPAARLLASLERRACLREVYRREAHDASATVHELWLIAEALLDFAQAYHTFRFRHVKMVERMIGNRRGTGGSPGVAYLEQTLRYRVFPELWRVRTYL